jgi:hypothetical protein
MKVLDGAMVEEEEEEMAPCCIFLVMVPMRGGR